MSLGGLLLLLLKCSTRHIIHLTEIIIMSGRKIRIELELNLNLCECFSQLTEEYNCSQRVGQVSSQTLKLMEISITFSFLQEV